MARLRLAYSLILFAVTAQAQADTAKALPTVSVTASRSGTSLFTVPLAVTRVTASDWNGQSGYGLDGALQNVPGVLAQSRNGNSDIRLTIRGFGSRGAGDRSNSGTSRGVRVLTNGVPETEPDGRTAFDNVDLGIAQSIEVVRSNASALWGNAAGGVINISTVPTFTQPYHEIQSSMGGWGLKRLGFSFGEVFGDGRVYGSVVSSAYEGYRANSGSSRTAIDAGVVAPFGGSTTLRAMLAGAINKFDVPGPLTQVQYDADPTQANATYLSRRERRDNKLGRMAIGLDHNFSDVSSFSSLVFLQPKYLQRSERNTYRDFNRYHLGGNGVWKRKHAMGDNKATFTIGTDVAYQDGAIQFYTLSATQERGTTLTDNKREGANNFGVFVSEDVEIGAKWLLALGARYDAITYTYSSNITPASNSTKSFTGVTPKVGLTYRMSPTQSWFVSYGGGVEVPAGNETDPEPGTPSAVFALNPLLEPIKSSTFELGTRRVWATASADAVVTSLSYDVAAFITKVQNEIVPYNGGRFYFTAGEAERAGFELGGAVNAIGGWSLKGSFTWMDATYSDYVVDSVHYGKAGAKADYSGNRIVGLPQTVTHATLGWAPGVLKGLQLQGSIHNIGEYVVDDANKISVPASSILSAGLVSTRSYQFGTHFRVRGSVMVTNITDAKYAGSAYLNPDRVTVSGQSVPTFLEPGLPRQVVVSLSVGHTR
jgi:iron complex outermembrane receptor protein